MNSANRVTVLRALKLLVPVAVLTTAACSDTTGPPPDCIRASTTVATNFNFGAALRAPATVQREVATSDLGALSAGNVKVLSAPEIAGGLQFPSGNTDRNYLIVVGNTNPEQDSVAHFVVSANQVTGTQANRVVGLSSLTSPTPARVGHAHLPVDAPEVAHSKQRSTEQKIRQFEREHLNLQSVKAVRTDNESYTRSSLQASVQCGLSVGDTLLIKIPNAASSDLCNDFTSTRAVVAAVSSKAIIAVDTLDGDYRSVFPSTVLNAIATEFDNVTYPTDVSYFNTPLDMDKNGHVIMVFSGQINKLTPPNTAGSFVGGFFFAGDLFPTTGKTKGSFCPESNRREVFYLLSPDPTGRFGNVRTPASVQQTTRGTIAHEFQHMINSGNRYVNPAVKNFESTWLDEGLAHFAEDAVGRAVRGFGDLQTLTYNDILPCSSCSQANDFDAFFFQNLARLTYWMAAPDSFAPMSKMADTSLAVRGAAWALVRYAADNYSGAAPRALTRKLVAGPDTGVTNLTAATGATVDTLIAGWLVSMYADHRGIAGLDPKYEYKSYNFHDVMPPIAKDLLKLQTETYPLAVQAIGSGSDNIQATNRSGSGTYYILSVPAGSGTKTVRVLDPSGTDANYPGEHVYVLRLN